MRKLNKRNLLIGILSLDEFIKIPKIARIVLATAFGVVSISAGGTALGIPSMISAMIAIIIFMTLFMVTKKDETK